MEITKLAVCHGDVSVGMRSLASVAEMDWEGFFSRGGAGWARLKNYGVRRCQSLLSLAIFFYHGLLELERFQRVTFVLPRQCPADFTIFAGRGGVGSQGRCFTGQGRGGAGNPSLICCCHDLWQIGC